MPLRSEVMTEVDNVYDKLDGSVIRTAALCMAGAVQRLFANESTEGCF